MIFMQILTFILIVLAIILFTVLVSMLVTYQHDSLISFAIDTKKDIKNFRSNRYIIAKIILDNSSSYGAVALKNSLKIYPKIKNEKDEIIWEEKWLPAMKKYIDNNHFDSSVKKSFIENETNLSLARENLIKTENSIARMEENKILILFIRIFVWLSSKTKNLPSQVKNLQEQANNNANSVKDVVNRFSSNTNANNKNSVTPNIRKYGNQTYFVANDKNKISK